MIHSFSYMKVASSNHYSSSHDTKFFSDPRLGTTPSAMYPYPYTSQINNRASYNYPAMPYSSFPQAYTQAQSYSSQYYPGPSQAFQHSSQYTQQLQALQNQHPLPSQQSSQHLPISQTQGFTPDSQPRESNSEAQGPL